MWAGGNEGLEVSGGFTVSTLAKMAFTKEKPLISDS